MLKNKIDVSFCRLEVAAYLQCIPIFSWTTDKIVAGSVLQLILLHFKLLKHFFVQFIYTFTKCLTTCQQLLCFSNNMVYVKYWEVMPFCFTTRLSWYLLKTRICRVAQIQCVHSHNRKIHFSNRTEAKIQYEKMQSNMNADNTQNLLYLLA